MQQLYISVVQHAGTFAENKDIAQKLRLQRIEPALASGDTVVLDFGDVTGATQSFIHALISEPIREHGDDVFELLLFKNCTPLVQEVVRIVAEYMQESE